MAKKVKLGIPFSYNENWIGGSYYILNLINALRILTVQQQPQIFILSEKISDFKLVKKETNYADLKYLNPYKNKRNYIEALLNKLGLFIFNKNIIEKRVERQIDILFPASFDNCYENVFKKIFWFPDFQHIHLPDYFSTTEIELRNRIIKKISASNDTLILSSLDAFNDWKSMKYEKKCNYFVLPFAVTHNFISNLDPEKLLQKYNLKKNYFIISNQFWKHKNHLTVFKAIKILNHRGVKTQFVFTGKQVDLRDDNYFQNLLDYIYENELSNSIKILGLIDRKEQLQLIKHARLVIQPSLFEGWSTFLEDAKSLNKYVIASDILIHQEQLSENVTFFEKNNEYDLAEKIQKFISADVELVNINYNLSVMKFGLEFSNILSQIVKKEI